MVPFFEQFATPFRQQDPNAKKTQVLTVISLSFDARKAQVMTLLVFFSCC